LTTARRHVFIFGNSMHSTFCAVRLAWLQLMVAISATGATQTVPAWPQFRGPGGNALALDGAPPTRFGPGTNVLWKADVAPGHSSPIVWGNRIFLTGSEKGRLLTLCLDRATGAVLWQREITDAKLEPSHRIGSPAASTPCTDGQSVFVYFGSFGLKAYDFEGNQRWQIPLPPPMVEFGTGTSPILVNDRIILVSDGDQGSYLLAVDKQSGRQGWRTERTEFRRGFSTPYLWQHDGLGEIVVPGSIWLRAYDPKDGSERWSFTGTSRVANSTPCAGDGLLFSASWNIGADPGDRITLESHEDFARANDANRDGEFVRDEFPAGPLRERFSQMDINKDGRVNRKEWGIMREMFARAGNAVLAIRPGGRSDITETHLAWKATRSLPYVSSPVFHDGRLYTVKNGGLASCYEARTGRVLYQDERLDAPGDYYASLVAGEGKVIAISQKGTATVLAAGDSLKILARNEIGTEVMATPALVAGILYLRSAGYLFAFGPRAAGE
jgi:outer membrane protein assembly factor BamB